MASVGIMLDVKRFEANLQVGHYFAEGSVTRGSQTSSLQAAISSNSGLNVIVSGDSLRTGATQGTTSLVGVMSDSTTINDELAHGLGNTNAIPLLGNTLADQGLNIEELSFDLLGSVSDALEEMLRGGASAVGCAVGSQGCSPTKQGGN